MEEIPELLLQLLQEQYTEKEVNKILEGYQTKRETTLRVNTLKATVEEIKQILQSKKIEFEQMPWYPEAFVLRNIQETEIEKGEIYEQGKIYLQSLSSMLPVLLLEPKKKVDILDMAAAPGGKTTQLAALTQNTANITACEMNKMRAERLKYNIEKQGASSVYVMLTDSRKLDSCFSFDQILLDAPCSGSGTITICPNNLWEGFFVATLRKLK